MLKGSLCCLRFVPDGALWNNKLCWLWPASAGPLLTPRPQSRSPFKLSPGPLSTPACIAEELVSRSAAAMPLSGHEPFLNSGLILTQPQTSFITTWLLVDQMLGCHPQVCPTCCAWLLWGCTLIVRHLPCQLHCTWLLAPCLPGSRWFFLYSYSNCACW